jgi:hypothetical protein
MLADRQTRKPLGDVRWFFGLVLRLGAEIALGLVVVWVAWLEQRHNPPPSLGVPWTLFWAFTIFIFAPPLARHLNQWRRLSFWVVVGGLLVVHIAWWTNYIRSWFRLSWDFPIWVWVLWGLAEYGAVQVLFYWRFSPDRRIITLGAFLDKGKTATKPRQ